MPKVSTPRTALVSHFDEFSFSICCTSLVDSNSGAKLDLASSRPFRFLATHHTIPYIGWGYHFSLGNAQIFSDPAHHYSQTSVLCISLLLRVLHERAGLSSLSGTTKRRGALRRDALRAEI